MTFYTSFTKNIKKLYFDYFFPFIILNLLYIKMKNDNNYNFICEY